MRDASIIEGVYGRAGEGAENEGDEWEYLRMLVLAAKTTSTEFKGGLC